MTFGTKPNPVATLRRTPRDAKSGWLPLNGLQIDVCVKPQRDVTEMILTGHSFEAVALTVFLLAQRYLSYNRVRGRVG